MVYVLPVALSVAAVSILARWANRRWRSVDSYHEREYQEPLIFDAGNWLGGGRI